jgi:class 3 adenylate cyclase
MGDPDRRLAAVWFCDVVGSTEIAEELGDRAFRWLIERFLAVARSAIHGGGGREIDTAGDGMFAIFDAPAAALQAAWEATTAVRDLGVEIRSGIHLGEVEQDPDGRVGGIAVHIGARVASLANAGEIFTTATTGELASGGGFRFERRGTHALKGLVGRHAVVGVVEVDGERLGDPLEADEAARRRAAASTVARSLRSMELPTVSAPVEEQARLFVGRVRELEELRSALGDASAGHGSLFLISGEPGIGKSRLMEEVADHAEEDGWRVLTGRCWEGGGAPAYWPWIQVVRAAGGEFDGLASTPVAGRPTEGTQRSPVDPEAARFRLFDEVGRFLAEAARDRPCLIVLDDLHVADEPSLLLLRFLATSVHDRPFVALGSYRETEPTLREHAELFGELARFGRRVPLRGLSPDEVARYMAIASGDVPAEAMAAKVSDVTGGNPFFLGEVVRTLMAEGKLTSSGPEALRLPEEVRALIRRRVSGLSPEAVNTLRVAAVVGRDFDLRVLESTSMLEPDRLVDVLAEIERAGVIVTDRDHPEAYAFAHDLVRTTLYEDLPVARRRELHRTVGVVLEGLFADDLEPHLAEIAYHLSQAAPLGEAARAVEYSVRAGDRAAAVLAYEDSARQYERALMLLAPSEATSVRRAEILLRLGDARSRAGDPTARGTFEEAAGIGRREADPELMAEAALGYARVLEPVQLGLGGILITAQTQLSTTAIALLEDALKALPEGDGPLRARALARLATELYVTDPGLRLEISQRALDMALRLGDPAALLAALQGRHWATLAPEGVHDRLSNAQQMLLMATGANDDEAAFLARQARLHCFLEMCDPVGVDGELDAMDGIAMRSRQPFRIWHAAGMRAMRTLLSGRAADAEREARQAVGALGQTEQVEYMVEHAQMVAIRWSQGRLDELLPRIRDHNHRYPYIPRWRDALAAAEVGDVGAARAEIERHARDDFATLPRDGLWILHLSSLAQACVLVGDERRAATLYELLSPYADRMAISVSTMPFGPVAMRLGMLATLLQLWKEADEHFGLALDRCRVMGALAFEARILVEQAAMLSTRGGLGDEEQAEGLLSQALATSEELDLSGVAERAAGLLAKRRDDEASSGRVADRATFQREGQYWTLAYGAEMARLHDLKGLRYIHALLSAPGREVHVLELAGLLVGSAPAGPGRDDGLKVTRLEGSEAVLDPPAKESYRRRLGELAEDLEEARSWNDPERVARIEEEIDALTTELERALGLGGRDRGMPSQAERARVSVTKAIRGAVRAISMECPGLGEHLAASLRTGRFCTYAPPGHEPPTWDL